MKREGVRSVPAFHFWKGGSRVSEAQPVQRPYDKYQYKNLLPQFDMLPFPAEQSVSNLGSAMCLRFPAQQALSNSRCEQNTLNVDAITRTSFIFGGPLEQT